jgi:hypothetical protein
MQNSLDTGGSRRDIQGRAIDHGRSRRSLRAIPGAEIVIADSPGGVIGRSGHDADLMSAVREPDCHLAGILAYSRELG